MFLSKYMYLVKIKFENSSFMVFIHCDQAMGYLWSIMNCAHSGIRQWHMFLPQHMYKVKCKDKCSSSWSSSVSNGGFSSITNCAVAHFDHSLIKLTYVSSAIYVCGGTNEDWIYTLLVCILCRQANGLFLLHYILWTKGICSHRYQALPYASGATYVSRDMWRITCEGCRPKELRHSEWWWRLPGPKFDLIMQDETAWKQMVVKKGYSFRPAAVVWTIAVDALVHFVIDRSLMWWQFVDW